MTGGRSIGARVAGRAFLIVMVDGYDTLMISFIAPLLVRQWGLAPTDLGRLFGIGYLGAIVGAIVIGPLADRLGRKPMLVASLLLAGASTLACAGAGSFGALLALRFVAGIALGGALPALIALTAEHADPARRSGTVTIMYIGYPMGAVVGGAVTAALLHRGVPSIFVGAGLASLIAAGVALTLPESPMALSLPLSARPRARGLFVEQFAEGRLWPALTLWAGLFCTLLLTYFLLSWTPSMIVARGGSVKAAALGAVLLNLGGICGALLMAPLINRRGPYLPTAALVAVGALLVAALGWNAGSMPLTMALLFGTGVCVMGAQLNFPAMTADLFPPRVRSTGSGWTVGFGRLGSIAGPVIGGILVAARLGAGSLFLVAAAPALATAVLLLAAGRLRGGGR